MKSNMSVDMSLYFHSVDHLNVNKFAFISKKILLILQDLNTPDPFFLKAAKYATRAEDFSGIQHMAYRWLYSGSATLDAGI